MRAHNVAHIGLSGLGAAAALGASLGLSGWYTFESIGTFGFLGAWAATIGLVSTAKLHTVALAEPDLDRSDGLLLVGAGLAIGLSALLATALYGFGRSVSSVGNAVSLGSLGAMAAWTSGLALSQTVEARLQRDGLSGRLGTVRLLRGVVFAAALYAGRGGGTECLVQAAAASYWLSVTAGFFDWRPAGPVIPTRREWSRGIAVTGSSATLSLSESMRFSLLALWLPGAALGTYVYFQRIARGSYLWPGQLYVDRNLTAFTRLSLGLPPMLERLRTQVIATAAVMLLAVATAATATLYWTSDVNYTIDYALAVVLEVGLGFAIAIRRSLPVLYGRLRRQLTAEVILGAVWVGLTAIAAVAMPASALTVGAIGLASTLSGYLLYNWVLNLPEARFAPPHTAESEVQFSDS